MINLVRDGNFVIEDQMMVSQQPVSMQNVIMLERLEYNTSN